MTYDEIVQIKLPNVGKVSEKEQYLKTIKQQKNIIKKMKHISHMGHDSISNW